MIKRFFALILCFTLILCAAACGKNPDEAIVPSQKKVAILVAPQAQYPEDYAAAMAIQKEYADSVVVKEYADSRILKAGDSEIITLSEQLAADSTVGAILYARATEFTDDAIYRAKAKNPALVTVAIEPEDNVEAVAEAADLVLCCDWQAAAADMVNTAKGMGADTFLYFSVIRHSENPLIAKQTEAFRAACREAGLTFCSANGADPTAAEGIANTATVLKEQLGRMVLNQEFTGNNAVLFSTDSAVQTALVSLAEEKGMLYLAPNFPSAYSGLDTYFEVAAPKKLADTKGHIDAVKKAAAAAQGRYACYNYNLMQVTVNAAVYCAFDFLNGTATADNVGEKVALRFGQASDGAITPTRFDAHIPNIWCGYKADAYTVIKK